MQDSHDCPDQSFVGISFHSGTLWDSFNYDLFSSTPFFDENGLDFDWQGSLIDNFDLSWFLDLNTQPWTEQYAGPCLGDVNALQSATMPLSMADQMGAAHTYQLRPTPLATMTPIWSTSLPSETSNQSSSLPPHEEQTPSPSSTSSKTYICSTCQPHRSYCTPQLLKRHQKTHTKPIACQDPGCTERFAENRDMKRHVSVHHPALLPQQLYFCSESGCKYSREGFGRRDNLMRHFKKVHGLLVRANDA